MADDPLATAVGELVSGDEELQRRLRALLVTAINAAQRDMTIGSPAVRAALVAKLIPAAMRVLGEEQKADELADLRQQVAEMNADIRGMVAGGPTVVAEDEGDEPDVPRDGPVRLLGTPPELPVLRPAHAHPPPVPDTAHSTSHPTRGDGRARVKRDPRLG